MTWFDTGLFEGIKLHEGETPWMKQRKDDLRRVLSFAEEKGLPAMIHAGEDVGCRPSELAKLSQDFPSLRFNFAHCRPMDEMAKVIAECPNVWTDTAYLAFDEFSKLCDYDWHGRLMFGTDLPVWQSHEDVSLAKRYREYVLAFRATGLEKPSCNAFRSFLSGGRA